VTAQVVHLDNGPPIACVSLRVIEKGKLRGFCDLEIPAWHLVFRDCAWMRGEYGDWIALPSSSFTKNDGAKAYKKLVEFTDKDVARRFNDTALAAVERYRQTMMDSARN
jgi:DNA-binding cell septation regulator SpoVG